jgi:MFS family permease
MMLGTQLGDVLCGAEPSGRGVFAMFAAAGLLGIAAIPFAWVASQREKTPARRKGLPMLWVVRRYQPGMLLAVGVVTGVALSVPSTFLRTYAAELGIPRIGLFFTVVGLTAVATRVASRRLPQRFGLAPILLVGLAVMALAQLLFLIVRSEWQLIVPGLVHGVAQAILYPMVTAAGSSSFPSRYRGLGTLLILASLDIGQLIGAPAAGMVLHLSEAAGWASYPTMFLAMAAVLSSVAGTYAVSLKRTARVRGGSNGRGLPRRVNGTATRLKPAGLPLTSRQAAGSSRSTAAGRR